MAEFLSQGEIDALLDITGDSLSELELNEAGWSYHERTGIEKVEYPDVAEYWYKQYKENAKEHADLRAEVEAYKLIMKSLLKGIQ